jgi:hypothetical protein
MSATAKTVLKTTKRGRVASPKKNRTPDADVPDGDCLDWDFCFESPPPRAHGTLNVKVKYVGRSKPIA